MQARDVVGRTIVGIRQERSFNRLLGQHDWALLSIDLDNGTSIVLRGRDDADDVYAVAEVVRP